MCTTEEVVASWSVKATPEEMPVMLSPCRVMLMAESSEDKSSFISSGSRGSGLASYLEFSLLQLPRCVQSLWV